ncbi:WhiB family transcriptional regulator [Streptomyces sp. NPDC004783]|uniref:WhiB family transcriptional regulator n=1 Tax=Streptomyces sp. NPDC004783 TaxID=3154459 RepID=UPI0033A80E4F
MSTNTRLGTTNATPDVNWRLRAACRAADPDLFWPDPDTPPEQIREAKRICDNCPVKQTCLDEAFRTNEWEGISGGLTGPERAQILNPRPVVNRFQARRMDNADARKLAVQFGADILVRLVKQRMSVADVAEAFGATPRSLYGAFRLLVPAPRVVGVRTHVPSGMEKLLRDSKECMKTLERMGRSHSEIARVLGTSQSIISASLAVLRQREEAWRRISGKGPQDAIERCWAEEIRIRRESGSGLTVDDVVDMCGPRIVALHGEGLSLRMVAEVLGVNRELVRKAYQRMTEKRVVKTLAKSDMEEAA